MTLHAEHHRGYNPDNRFRGTIYRVKLLSPPYRHLSDGVLFRVEDWVDRIPGPGQNLPWTERAKVEPNWTYLHHIRRFDSMLEFPLHERFDVVYGHVVRDENDHGTGYLLLDEELVEEVVDLRDHDG